MFLFGMLVGAILSGIVFVIFYKNNQRTLEKARTALLSVYDRVGDRVGDLVGGIDKNLDKNIEERKQNSNPEA